MICLTVLNPVLMKLARLRQSFVNLMAMS
jgi:hypothetical protein